MSFHGRLGSHRSEAERWSIFSLVSPELISEIKFATVFGSSGNEAIFVTKNDDVYALGTNCSGCLGLGDATNCLKPKKIDILCGKKVCCISCGIGPHVLAATADGLLYVWGHNGYCQLGNGGTNQLLSPSLCNSNLQDKKVTQLSCGSHHSVALTIDGEIYCWGQNNCGQVGSGTTSNQPAPRKITASLMGKFIIVIACSQASSFALTNSGEVYGWGYNGSGQLGIGNNLNQANPHKVEALSKVVITNIVCGFGHTVILTDEGSLWTWGANSYGQLGSGNKANSLSPVLIASDKGHFIEIGAIHYSNTTVAMIQTGCIFAWGLCRGQSVVIPMETRFHSINDAFAALSTPPVTVMPLYISNHGSTRVSESLKLAFNDQSTSDIAFVIEGQYIYAHRAVLKIRCDYFKSMFQSHWDENSRNEIEVNEFSFPVYKAFINYLYTDNVDLNPEEAIGLLDLSNSYCENELKILCQRLIKHCISVDNVMMLYAAAIKFSAVDLENYCFYFAINHLTAVTNTEAFRQLDDVTLKDFLINAAKHGAFKF